MLTRRAARQQQNGNVWTTNQQEQEHSSEQKVQSSAQALDKLIVESFYCKFEMFRKMFWSFFLELLNERLESGICRRMRHPGFEPDQRHHASRGICRELPGKINVAITPGEAWRRNSNDRVRLACELDAFAY